MSTKESITENYSQSKYRVMDPGPKEYIYKTTASFNTQGSLKKEIVRARDQEACCGTDPLGISHKVWPA